MKPRYNFDWLKDRNNLTIFVRPDLDTALIVPKRWSFLKQHELIGGIVISAPKHYDERMAIRETWGQLIKPLFIIGLHKNKLSSSVSREAEIYDDIIVEDFVDSYLNLTIKSAYAFKTFLKYYNGSKFFLKADDDVFIRVENLRKLLRTVSKNSLVGRIAKNREPVRDETSKWCLPEFLYPNQDTFPPYLFGPSYLIPGHLARSIYETSLKIPFHTIEDTFFTGDIPTKILNYTLHNSFDFEFDIYAERTCAFENLIVVAGTEPWELRELFQKLEIDDKCKDSHVEYVRLGLK